MPSNGMVRARRIARAYAIGCAAVHPKKLRLGELIALAGGVLLAIAVFLPWYEPSPSNPNSNIDGMRGALSGWTVHTILRYLFLAAAAAPAILVYIIVRDHKLSWGRGEMTAVVAVFAFGL